MTQERKTGTSRNYGIDLLRLISMLYVVILHILGHGGVLNRAVEGTVQYQVSWFIEIWAYCAVDIFAIISGYVGFSETRKRYNYANYLVMWIQVVTYGAAIVILLQLVNPNLVSKKDLLSMFFPVSNNCYWYFTAYTGLFLVIPLINEALRQFSQNALKMLFVILLLVFSVFDNMAGRFALEKGYSVAWLTVLYILGAIIRKCDIGKRFSASAAFAGIVLCCVVSWIWKMYGFEINVMSIKINKDLFVSYLSPTTVFTAILYVILFSKIQLRFITQKILSFAAPGAFAVYLLNDHRFARQYLINERFLYLAESSVWNIFVHTLGIALTYLVVAVVVDHMRQKVFSILKVKEIATYLMSTLEKMVCNVGKLL